MTHEFHLKHYPIPLNGIPKSWAVSAVRLLCGEPQSGFACGRHNSQGRGVVHLRPMNVSSAGEINLESVKHVEPDRDLRVEHGDVLFNNTNSPAWVGKTAPILKPDDWAFLNHMTRLRPHSELDHRYLAGQLQFLQACGYFRHLCVNHVNQASINGDVLSDSVPILVPPSNEQTRIADRIDELFTDLAAGVAALERVRKKLKRYRSAVLHAAVTGRLTEAWRQEHGPPAESGEQLLERLLVERRRQWEERTLADYEAKGKQPPKNWQQRYVEPVEPKTEDLPELPKGWCWASLEQAGWLQRGRSRHRPRDAEHLYGGPYPFIQTGDVRRANQYVTEHLQTYSEAGLAQSQLWPPGTLCITIAANIAETAILTYDACFPDSVVGYRTDPECLSIEYVMYGVEDVKARLASYAPATAQKNINDDILSRVPLAVPPLAEQVAVIDAVQEKLSQVDAMEAEVQRGLARAARLRQAILKSAFAGELVPQDPNDEPASALLERIRAEREAMAAESNGRPKRSPRKKAAPKKTAKVAKKSTKKKARKS